MPRGNWIRSSRCHTANCCVEVRFVDGGVWVRDSKNREGAYLTFTDEEWLLFTEGVRNSEFDR